ncbi:lipase family alpha/beta hydrolase [Acetohalobium arabaticum]|uniref:Alpha/beta hydrolase fold protein n=1 Tax=Acetohalobium arabaticum (strain ATCC 49924 / DSM 5501 / Z-7288) TaxID=574087 RepID=D9QQD1_ACEAZ|nr:alpha/beta fold hydrolase [Acetohalobium arabaticum]ADL12722.1 alpha/beta hydrolase fold protein [Acetohalobium arabaticum DSM 5501]
MNNKVVLVHGFSKDSRDMLQLQENLNQLGYEGITVDLPLTFKTIETAASIFKKEMEILISSLDDEELIHLVGHSTGGLIVRNFLATTDTIDKVGRAVLIGTPNYGSQLADIAADLSTILVNILKTLRSLQTEEVRKLELVEDSKIDIGAIAGNKNNLLLGKLLSKESDGLVHVESVKYEGLKDFIILSYGHKEIHYKFETAELVVSFLEKGKFE